MSRPQPGRAPITIDLTDYDFGDDESHEGVISPRDATANKEVIYVDVSPEPPDTRTIVLDVYQEVWDEYRKWKYHWSALLVRDLRHVDVSESAPASASLEGELVDSSSDGDDGYDFSRASAPSNITFVCATPVNAQAGPSTTITTMSHKILDTATTRLPPDTDTDPVYESYQPTNVNISVSVPKARDYMPDFIPYADEEGFDQEKYLEQFGGGSAWEEEEMEDPDVIEIQLETVRRLYYRNKLSLEDIEKTEVLPPLRTRGSGVLWKAKRKDLLHWPNSAQDLPPAEALFETAFPLRGIHDESSVRQVYFCPHPNCIDMACPTHHQQFSNIGRPPRPTMSSVALQTSRGKPCGERCFRRAMENVQDLIRWTEIELTDLADVLRVFPDGIPCDLARMVRKPCAEVFFQRRELIPDSSIQNLEGRAAPARASATGRELEFVDDLKGITEAEGHKGYVRVPPCNHPGEHCDTARCSCFKEKQHCVTMCQCINDCERRYPACDCNPLKMRSKTRICWHNSKCQCRLEKRECDPRRCVCCTTKVDEHGERSARKNKGKSKEKKEDVTMRQCSNMSIQQGDEVKLEVRKGKVGFGAFATTALVPKDYIGEYVGELRSDSDEEDVDPFNMLRLYTHRNYLFGLNDIWVVDGTRAGNDIRFINHGKDGNVEAAVILVNGDPRIGIWATKYIGAGEEILLNYGEEYWTAGDAPGSESESEEYEEERVSQRKVPRANDREEHATAHNNERFEEDEEWEGDYEDDGEYDPSEED
ncbi:SET domain-containing protein, partial [Stereum hirsutum FP-91666 SS1]|uniref:SET domain-containing protein n=1 Tax=Stereum hirsutum (strain FP-91666) TaxID=721885 RepID=UPI000440C478